MTQKESFFYPHSLTSGLNIELKGDQQRHLVKVLRGQVGDVVSLVNGKGEQAVATISTIGKQTALLTLQKVHKAPRTSDEITLIQALPKGNRIDGIVEKSTELGAAHIHFFPAEKSVRTTLSEERFKRLEQITIAALKQSRRLYLPKIKILPPIALWNAFSSLAFFGTLSPKAALLGTQLEKHSSQTISLIIGPESGLTAQEETTLRTLGAIGVSLSRQQLRTDTAAFCGLSLIHHWFIQKNR